MRAADPHMTTKEVAAYIEDLGFKTAERGDVVDVILGKNGLIRFTFHAKDFGEYGEGLAKAAKEFADELNPSLIYAVKVQEMTGMTPSEVSSLMLEEFNEVQQKGGITEAREQTDGAIANAKLLAKKAAEAAKAAKAAQEQKEAGEPTE